MTTMTILCVDDERMILDALKEQLRRAVDGVRIETAETGDEGLEVFRELVGRGAHVPLVISDQLMPGMRGEELLGEIHAIEPETLSVLLTGQATADAVGAAVNKARLYRYIGKPWTEGDLVTTAREALRAWTQARAIRQKEQELRAAHESSVRFVPREFLGLLGRERLVDVQFGDHVHREMNILFSDIRDYTSLVEGRSTAEAFHLVNEHMTMLDEAIRAHGGFIGNIEGDAVLALFASDADAAVRAGVAAHQSLRTINARRAKQGTATVGMGLAINTGDLLLGTIGGKERLQCDVIGDAVNVCARIESLTKLYDTAMIVSHPTKERLRTSIALREVDCVRVKGKRAPVTLYEVLDALDEAARNAKQATAELFAAGIRQFRGGRFAEASAAFREVREADGRDGAAALYLQRCARLAREGAGEAFDGVTNLRHKDGEA